VSTPDPSDAAADAAPPVDAAAPVARSVQYFEMGGHRGLWKDGWKAVTHHTSGVPLDQDDWELYHLDADFSETNNLAATEPDRLQALVAEWWSEAEKNGVLPIDDRGAFEVFRASRRPGMPTSRRQFIYHPPISHIVSDACPPVFRGWRMTVDLEQSEPCDGALISRGSLNSGYVLYLQDGRPVFDYNAFHDHAIVRGDRAVGPGRHQLEVEVARQANGSGAVSLRLDGDAIGAGTIPRLLLMISSLGMDFGRSPRPVCPDYAPPFIYPGTIHSVVFDLPPVPPELGRMADQAEVTAALSRQ
jgi:arylsulfatase